MATPTLGFALLTHSNPDQVVHLCRTLDRMFGGSPIACHHDFSKCDLPQAEFPAAVRFVRRPVETGWGGFSLVEATMRAIELLYSQDPSPNWFVLLSGADYPVREAHVIENFFQQANCDAFISAREVRKSQDDVWMTHMANRYLRRVFSVPKVLRGIARRKGTALPVAMSSPFLPFNSRRRCFAGSQWLNGNALCAKVLLDAHSAKPNRLRAHYERVSVPDESYLQTIVANNPTLRVTNSNLRFVEFDKQHTAHARVLSEEDLPKVLATDALFARKFVHGSSVVRQLDCMLLNKPSCRGSELC